VKARGYSREGDGKLYLLKTSLFTVRYVTIEPKA